MKKRLLALLITVVSLGCMGFCARIIYTNVRDYEKNNSSYEKLNEKVNNVVTTSQLDTTSSNEDSEVVDGEGIKSDDSNASNKVMCYSPINVESYRKKFLECQSINSDYCGWITIPNTYVNYPVVKGDVDYYLKHDFYRNPNEYGCIVVDKNCSNPFKESITILHGHHMANGTMFASLKLFKNQSFADANKFIYVDLDSNYQQYKIFSVFVEHVTEDSYKTGLYGKELVDHANWLKSKSIIRLDDFQPSAETSLLILSTCSYESENYRLLVCAYKVS